jgi:hypothetical protein
MSAGARFDESKQTKGEHHCQHHHLRPHPHAPRVHHDDVSSIPYLLNHCSCLRFSSLFCKKGRNRALLRPSLSPNISRPISQESLPSTTYFPQIFRDVRAQVIQNVMAALFTIVSPILALGWTTLSWRNMAIFCESAFPPPPYHC